MGGLIGAIIAFLIAFVLYSCDSQSSSSSEKTQAQKESDERWKQNLWNEKGKDAIRSRLKDPSSAVFNNVFFNDNGIPTSCGEINSKNSFGAYTGYQSYLYAGDNFAMLEEENKALFVKTWNELCVKIDKALLENLKKTPKEGTPIDVPSDSAKYFILEKKLKVNNNKNLRTIVSKRVGSSGVIYTKRLYDCKNKKFKVLQEGDTLEQMKSAKIIETKMSDILIGSIVYHIGVEACI